MNILENQLYKNDLNKALNFIDLTLLDKKKILITGGLGLIGSSIVDLIHQYNEKGGNVKIFVAVRNKVNYKMRYGMYEDISFVNYDACKKVKFKFKVDYIIHCAGVSSPDLFINQPVETMCSNFIGLLNLLEYSKKTGVKRLLYTSSSEVYGNKSTEDPFSENTFGFLDFSSIRASYPETKRASEVLCNSFSSEYGVDTVIVRPGHIYGPTASIKDKRVSSLFAYKAAKGEPLEMKSSGLNKRSYTYCVDCAVGFLIALLKGKKGESYNIGSSSVTTIREMAKIYAKAGKVNLQIATPNEAEMKAFNPMNDSSLNTEKIKVLGYKDLFSPEEGLTNTVKIIQSLLQ